MVTFTDKSSNLIKVLFPSTEPAAAPAAAGFSSRLLQTDQQMIQLPDAPRQRVAIGITAEKRYKSKLKMLEISIAVLLVLAALQLGAAAWLFISQM